jgi:hypothetical protein
VIAFINCCLYLNLSFLVSFHQNHTIVSLFILQSIKPTVLIGTSGQGRAFTQEVVEAMASFNEVTFVSFCYSSCNVEGVTLQGWLANL